MRRLAGLVMVLSIFAGVGYGLWKGLVDEKPDKYAIVVLRGGERASVPLPGGEIGIWYRERIDLPDRGSRNDVPTLPLPPGLDVVVRAPGSSKPIPLREPGGLYRYGGLNDMEFRQIKIFDAPRKGTYRLRIRGRVAGRQEAAVTFGPASTPASTTRLFTTSFTIIGVGILLSIVLQSIGSGRSRRRRRRQVASSPPPPPVDFTRF